MNGNPSSQSWQAGAPSLGLRKTIKLKASVCAGAAVLCAGLVGNVQAIPIMTQDEQEAGMRSWKLKPEQRDSAAALASELSARHQSIASPTASHFFSSVPAESVGEARGLGPLNSHHHKPGVPTPASTSVPDGGSTGLMMGGVFGGLALLVKRLKAPPLDERG